MKSLAGFIYCKIKTKHLPLKGQFISAMDILLLFCCQYRMMYTTDVLKITIICCMNMLSRINGHYLCHSFEVLAPDGQIAVTLHPLKSNPCGVPFCIGTLPA